MKAKNNATPRSTSTRAGATKRKSVAKEMMPESAKVPARDTRPGASLRTPQNATNAPTKYKPKRNESYMCPRQKEYFRGILTNWQKQLIEQADDTVNHIQHDTANYPDAFDRATREESFGMELQARSREYQLIQKIKTTINNIDFGKYGYCSKCSQEIGLARLEVRPTANLCIECKTLAEEHERLG